VTDEDIFNPTPAARGAVLLFRFVECVLRERANPARHRATSRAARAL